MTKSGNVLLARDNWQCLVRRVPFCKVIAEDETSIALMQNTNQVPQIFWACLNRCCGTEKYMLASGGYLSGKGKQFVWRSGICAKALSAARFVGFVENHNAKSQRHEMLLFETVAHH